MALYSLYTCLMLQMFGLRYIFLSFTQLNKRRIFLLRCLMWLSSFYIGKNVYELCFLFRQKNTVSFLNSFVSKKILISHFFSVSKVMNKIFRFCCYIWCTFAFYITKIKTQIYNFSLMINNDRIIMLYKKDEKEID